MIPHIQGVVKFLDTLSLQRLCTSSKLCARVAHWDLISHLRVLLKCVVQCSSKDLLALNEAVRTTNPKISGWFIRKLIPTGNMCLLRAIVSVSDSAKRALQCTDIFVPSMPIVVAAKTSATMFGAVIDLSVRSFAYVPVDTRPKGRAIQEYWVSAAIDTGDEVMMRVALSAAKRTFNGEWGRLLATSISYSVICDLTVNVLKFISLLNVQDVDSVDVGPLANQVFFRCSCSVLEAVLDMRFDARCLCALLTRLASMKCVDCPDRIAKLRALLARGANPLRTVFFGEVESKSGALVTCLKQGKYQELSLMVSAANSGLETFFPEIQDPLQLVRGLTQCIMTSHYDRRLPEYIVSRISELCSGIQELVYLKTLTRDR